jgi:hypothetical protein
MTLKIESLPIDKLKFDPTNARKHSNINLSAIAESLKQFGQRKPIVITAENVIVAGNGTVEAARLLGLTDVDVVRVPKDWDSDQVKAFALADNRTAELAEWNPEVLSAQLLELDEAGFDIEALGFELVAGQEIELALDNDLPSIKKPITKLGDVWVLDKHRIVCGDSSNENTLTKLLEGKLLDSIVQDPPYGVLDVDWDRPLNQQDLDLALSHCNGPVFMFNATKPDLFADVLALTPRPDRILVWRMTAGITGKGGMFWTWQPVFVWNANQKMTGWDSIEFESAAPDRTGQHLTQKPIGLIQKYLRAIPNMKTVGDFFLGSGTTLLAAELEGKQLFGCEINPLFVDVAVQRWEDLTGKKAVLENASR